MSLSPHTPPPLLSQGEKRECETPWERNAGFEGRQRTGMERSLRKVAGVKERSGAEVVPRGRQTWAGTWEEGTQKSGTEDKQPIKL